MFRMRIWPTHLLFCVARRLGLSTVRGIVVTLCSVRAGEKGRGEEGSRHLVFTRSLLPPSPGEGPVSGAGSGTIRCSDHELILTRHYKQLLPPPHTLRWKERRGECVTPALTVSLSCDGVKMTESPHLSPPLHIIISIRPGLTIKIFPSMARLLIIFPHLTLRWGCYHWSLVFPIWWGVWEPDFGSALHNDKQEDLGSFSQSPVGPMSETCLSHWQVLFTFPGPACFWSLAVANKKTPVRVVNQSEAWEQPGSGGDFSSLNVTGHLPSSPHTAPAHHSQKLLCSRLPGCLSLSNVLQMMYV